MSHAPCVSKYCKYSVYNSEKAYLCRNIWLTVSFICLMRTILICSFCLLYIVNTAFAQRIPRTKPIPQGATEGYTTVGIQVNAWNYVGDIPAGFKFTRPGMTAFFTRKISAHWQTRLQLSVGRIEGDDASALPTTGIYARNLHFRNDLKEVAGLLVYEWKGSYSKYTKRSHFTPYFIGGVAVLHHNPRAKVPTNLSDDWIDLQGLGTEGQGRIGYAKPYSKVQITVPMGIGFRFRTPDKRWDFAIEVLPRYTFTDYLDDVSGQYPEMADLGNPWSIALSNRTIETTAARTNTPRQLSDVSTKFGPPITYTGFDGRTYSTLPDFIRGKDNRGNAATKDLYVSYGFHVSYILNVGLKCPQARW